MPCCSPSPTRPHPSQCPFIYHKLCPPVGTQLGIRLVSSLGGDALLCTLLQGWGVAGSRAGSPPPWPPHPPILAVLTADDVSIGNVEVVRGYQGSALALSQLPVAAVMGMAAPVGDTMPNRCP